ncbi:Uncharacterised protein [uncultured archaeon]|nr:Uncharacterised protein [uncultured archaeon]
MDRYRFPFDEDRIPFDGIYVLFEKGELAHGGDRIVRVGTHTGENQLRSRLRQHFIAENKDRSIFRKNVGRCLLNRDNDPFLKDWELDLTAREAKEKHALAIDHGKQALVEKRVTEYIRDSFSFVVFGVKEKEKRLGLESKIISTVSLCDDCMPSERWLGRSSPKEKIRDSGLWLVNELYKEPFSETEMQGLTDILGIR